MKKMKLWSKRLAAAALSTSMVLGSTLPALADNGNQGTPSGAGEEGVQSVVEQAKTVSSVTCSDADEAEAEVAGEYYRNFEDAVEAAIKAEEELTMLSDVSDVQKITLDREKELEIDLNGHTIEFDADQYFFVTEKGSLKINGSGTLKEETDNENYGPIMMIGGKDATESSGPSLTINGDEDDPILLKGWSGLLIKQNGSASYNVKATLKNVDIKAVNDRYGDEKSNHGAGIFVNGTISAKESDNAKIPYLSLDNVEIESTGHGIFQSGNAHINANNCIIEGDDSGVEIRDGKVKLANSTIVSNSDEFELQATQNSGTAVYGAAFAVYPNEERTPEANLIDCNLTGYYPYFDHDADGKDVDLSGVNMSLPTTSVETSFNYDYIIPIDNGDKVIFDMNENWVSFKTGNYFYVDGGELTVQNGTVAEAPYDYAPIKIEGSEDVADDGKKYSVVNVASTATLRGWAGVYLGSNKRAADYGMVLNVEGEIDGNNDQSGSAGAAIYVNGYVGTKTGVGPQINIMDGAIINSTGHGIFQAGYATTTVKGESKIMANETGIEIRAGELSVMNGKKEEGKHHKITRPYIIGNAEEFSCEPNGNGSSTIGAGIAVVQHTTGQPINVTIEGGEIRGYVPLYQASPEEFSTTPEPVEMKVSRGMFRTVNGGNKSVYSETLTGFLYGGSYDVDPKAYVATKEGYFSVESEGLYFVSDEPITEGLQETYFTDGTGATGLAAKVVEELEDNEILYKFDLTLLGDAFKLENLGPSEYAKWIAPNARKLQFGLMYDVKAIEGKDITSNGEEVYAVKKIKYQVVPYLRQIAEDGVLYYNASGWNTDKKGECDFRVNEPTWFDTFDAAFPIPSSYPGKMVNVKINDDNELIGVEVETDENGNKFIVIWDMPGGKSEIVINFEDLYVEDPKPETPGTDEPGTDTPGTDEPGTDEPIVVVPTIEILTGEELSVFVGNTEKIDAEANDTDAAIKWSTSDATIATVDANGNLTTYKAGTVTITATIEGTDIKDTIKITVEKQGITFEILDLLVGTSATVEVAGDYNEVVWSSADTAVATVDQKGNVTAVGVGTTKITAVVNGIVELTCTVNVADMTVAGTQGNTEVTLTEEAITQKQEAAAADATANVEVPENVENAEAFKEEVKAAVVAEMEAVVNEVIADVVGNTTAIQPNEDLAAAAETVLKSQELEENEKALVYVNIVLEDVAVDVTTKVEEDNSVKAEAVPTKLTFKIEPFVKVFDADGNVKKEETKIENKELSGSFKVRIPIPKAMADKFTYATIDHKSEGYATKTYTLPIKSENGQYYVEMTLTHFSTFEVSFTNTKPYTGTVDKDGDSVKTKKPAPAAAGAWVQNEIGWWYRNADGTWPAAQWVQLEWNGQKTWYYFNAEGYMHTGWILDGGYWYFLHNVSDGTMGRMLTGWQQIDGKWYYFNPNVGGPQGSLLVNTVTPDGYTVDANGVWVQ